jgi:hypothetical protein
MSTGMLAGMIRETAGFTLLLDANRCWAAIPDSLALHLPASILTDQRSCR